MDAAVQKLKLKGQNPVLVLELPEDLGRLLADLPAEVHTSVRGKYSFILAFVRDLAGAKKIADTLVRAYKVGGYLWIAYPKGTSKKYKSDVNRDKLWQVLAPYDFEPVTLVSPDDDWSVMRFRQVGEIKTMARKKTASEKGKERIKSEKKS